MQPQRSRSAVDLRALGTAPPADGALRVDPERLAGSMSLRLEELWVEAHEQLRRADLDADAARRWGDALDQLVVALQAVEDAASPVSATWGHRTWSHRRP